MGIQLAIIDDNPHVTWDGQVYSVNATFQQFAAALLDVPGSPVTSVTSCVPLRAADGPPATRPLDPRIRVVGSAPFDGIDGYLRHLPAMLTTNRPILGRVITDADLLWIKVPASNAGLAAAIAARAGVPRSVWVAGSATDVARARFRGVAALGPRAIGAGYDLVGRLAGTGGHRIVVGEGVVDGDGVVASLVEPAEVRDAGAGAWPAIPWRIRLAWAGRLAEGKGLEALLDGLGRLAAAEEAGQRVELVILGDGPARAGLEARAVRLAVADRIHWLGHVADRAAYMDALASCDVFVFPSEAEGFPKAVLDAMAAGLPILATTSGHLGALGRAGILEPVKPDARAIAASIRGLAKDPGRARQLSRAGSAFVAAHTRPAEAARLVDRWRAWWPALPWDS